MINLQLHVLGIFLMREVAPTPRLAPIIKGSMHTPFSVPSSLKVDKTIFTLVRHRFYLMWTWTYHSWTLDSLQHHNSPQTAPIVRTRFESLDQIVDGLGPKSPIHWICRGWVGKLGLMNQKTNKVDSDDKKMKIDWFNLKKNHPRHNPRRSVLIYFSQVWLQMKFLIAIVFFS